MTATTPPPAAAGQPTVRPQPSGPATAGGVGGVVLLVATRVGLWLAGLLILVGQASTGGTSDAALRRAARWADAWQSPLMAPEAFAERVARLRASPQRPVPGGARAAWSDPHTRVADLVDQAPAWQAAGAEHLAVWLGAIDGFEWRMRGLAAATRAQAAR
jgi:hypothetical protein